MKTLIEMLESKREIKNKGITIIMNSNTEKFISFENLYKKSKGVLYNLQKKGLKPQDEVIFQIDDNEQFMYLFWACILGGMIPVPITVGNNDLHKMKVVNVWGNLSNPYIVTDKSTHQKLSLFLRNSDIKNKEKMIGERVIFIEELINVVKEGVIYSSKQQDIAFIQFSSGSTGAPKGVILTHHNLLTNIRDIVKRIEVGELDSMLSWMPLTHDMGLICCHLMPIFKGINQVNMNPWLFIRNPILWLKKANEYRTTILSSPNFGYHYFLKYFKEKYAENWDLSCIRLILNGAEPIAINTVNEFLKRMTPYDLKTTSMYPVYGMAEATVGISGPTIDKEINPIYLQRQNLNFGKKVKEVGSESEDAAPFVAVGFPVDSCQVRICDNKNNVMEDMYIGNIQIRGDNVTQGYYNNIEATNETITSDGWLKTGDLGFMMNGEIVITGRAKEIIIINGQNIYPHDIERMIESLPSMELGKVVACGVFNEQKHTDELILFILYKGKIRSFIPLLHQAKQIIQEMFAIPVKNIIPIKKIPKTTSGKVRRLFLAQCYREGMYTLLLEEIKKEQNGLELIDNIQVESIDYVERKMQSLWEKVFDKTILRPTDNFFEIGGDSLKANLLNSMIEESFNLYIPINKLFEAPTIIGMSKVIKLSMGDVISQKGITVNKGAKKYEASFAQKQIYMHSQLYDNKLLYNLPHGIFIEGKINYDKFQQVCEKLIARHVSLRTSFLWENQNLFQIINDKLDLDVEYCEIKENEVDNLIADFVQEFDLKCAPLMRIKLIKINIKKYLILFDIHHMIADGTAIKNLITEGIQLYKGNKLKQDILQYYDYLEWRNSPEEKKKTHSQLNFWKEEFLNSVPKLNLPTDFNRSPVKKITGEKVDLFLTEEMTNQIRMFSRAQQVTPFMFFLAAYNVLLSKYSHQKDIVIGVPVDGRKQPDLFSVVGMFVNSLPLRNYPNGNKQFDEFLNEVKEKNIKMYGNSDYPFEKLVEQLDINRDPSRMPLFDVMINYLTLENELMDNLDVSCNLYDINKNISMFDLNLIINEKRKEYRLTMEYSTDLYKKETVKLMLGRLVNIIEQIIENPKLKLEEIELLTRLERMRIVENFNKSKKHIVADFNF
ncbi:condensation domain-containing protein [Bacillus cereus]|uniref:condensation domain-containing protein n=1 Tax=Bacillus cereus TaxID=1396 RepID=UPI002ED7D0CC